MKGLRIISAAIIAGFAARDLGASGYVAFAATVLTGLLLITILEAGSWKDDS